MNDHERKHIETLRPYLAECTVLLKKDGKFPLGSPCRIAAYGSGVRFTVKGGTGSGEVNSRYFVNVEQGLRDAGFDVVGSEWSDRYEEICSKAKQAFKGEIKAKAKRDKTNILAASMGIVMKAPDYELDMDFDCDAAIYVVSRISGEGNDRLAEKGDFMLTDSEVRDIRLLNDRYDRFMLVINAGGPVDLSPVTDAGNILVLSQLGVETGAALADILLGKAYPSGKLATTWAAFDDYSKEGDFGERDDARYREGIYVGYRYFDAFGKKPLFPFGYGLGYTDFSVKAKDVKVTKDSMVTVSAVIKNTGKYPGKETMQVYVSCPSGKLDREAKSLAAFAKTKELKPGSQQTLKAQFDIRDLAAWDDVTASYILEAGDYIVMTGSDSASAEPAALLRLGNTFIARKAERLFTGADFDDIRPATERGFDTKGLPVAVLDLSRVKTEIPKEKESYKPFLDDQHIAYMTDEELAYLNIGAFDPKTVMPFVIGDASFSVAGAAGETSGLFKGRGIPALVMADGPAGVRISRQYYEDKNGKHAIGSAMPEGMIEMLPTAARKAMQLFNRVKKSVEIKEQYCTAIPIGTAIAQSWNTGFAGICGKIIGAEMEVYGIDLWLAPALNIHRNVLCGRNFEYYSEDPLISGKTAAAITNGVQSVKGRGVTIKHYAANSQETNRYASNSMVSERALREIYLKGFGICIRESDPVSIMTSYNLLNGEHTSESKALVKTAREEYGFDGVFMTDWVVGGTLLLASGSKYTVPDPALVADGGTSLFMPGGKADLKAMLKGLEEGRVSRAKLKENAAWLMYVISRLGKNNAPLIKQAGESNDKKTQNR